jgi:hypothetical protein
MNRESAMRCGKLVVQRPDRRFLAALDRHHAVEEIADKPGLNRSGAPDKADRIGLERQQRRADRGEKDAHRRDLIGRHAGSGKKRRRGLGPFGRP